MLFHEAKFMSGTDSFVLHFFQQLTCNNNDRTQRSCQAALLFLLKYLQKSEDFNRHIC